MILIDRLHSKAVLGRIALVKLVIIVVGEGGQIGAGVAQREIGHDAHRVGNGRRDIMEFNGGLRLGY